MYRRPELWRFGWAPLLLNIAITFAVAIVFVASAVALVAYLHPKFPQSTWGIVFECVSVLGLIVLAVGGAAASWIVLQSLLCGHFYNRLAREVAIQLGAKPDDLREAPWAGQMIDSISDFAKLVGINVALLALHCVPVVGSLISIPTAVYVDCMFFGREFLGYPLALRGMRRDAQLAYTRRHRMQTVGLGAAVLLCNFVPIFGAVVLTTAATGAVLLDRRLCEKETS